VDRPTVASQRGSGPPDLEVEQVDLRLALLPLLARTVVIDSLALEGVTLRVTRGPEGIELPVAPVPAGAEPVPAPPGSEEPEAGALRVALGEVRLTRSRLILEDRAVAPAVTWDLGDVELRARGSTLDGPIDVALSGELASGGHVGVEGKVRLDGEVDLAVKLDDLALVRASPYLAEYLGPKGGLAGTLVARVVAKGPVASPTRLEADVRLADGRVETGDVRLLGGATLRADLEGGLEAASGTFELDATDAELVYGESFHKPRGMPAKLAGRLVPGKDGQLAIEDLRVRAANLEASGKLRGGAPTRVELAVPPFDLRGWDELLPALAGYELGGRVAAPMLTLVPEPFDLRGDIQLDAVTLRPPESAMLELRGSLKGAGTGLRGEALELIVGGQRVAIDLELRDLAGTPRWSAKASGKQLDSDALLAALAEMKDTLHGPLDLGATLDGPLVDERDPLETLTGQLRIDVGKGQLKGVSLLRSTFERLGAVGEAALLLGALRGGKTLQRFYEDEFESITGTFRLADGRARTDDLRLVYRHYTADLRGSFGLLDESLDFKGDLTIGPEVDAALSEASESGTGSAPAGRSRVIPLAGVRGTLSEPRVDLASGAVSAFMARYAGGARRGELERKIEERLGEGTGREVIGVLEGILGGKRRAPTPPGSESPGSEAPPAETSPPPPTHPPSENPPPESASPDPS
jgi:AsmA protein